MILRICMIFSYLALGASKIFCMRSMDSRYHTIQGPSLCQLDSRVLHGRLWHPSKPRDVELQTAANGGSNGLKWCEICLELSDVVYPGAFSYNSFDKLDPDSDLTAPLRFSPGSHVLVVKKDGSFSKWPQSDKWCKIMLFNFEPSHCTIPRSCHPRGSQLVARSVKNLLPQVGSEAITCYVLGQQ